MRESEERERREVGGREGRAEERGREGGREEVGKGTQAGEMEVYRRVTGMIEEGEGGRMRGRR